MAEFENPYAQANPLVRAHFDCLSCGGKLWEYAIQNRMVCEDCGELFDSSDVFDASLEHE
ncbi:hypothetical protein SAMN04487948_110121 [Halogranum amylolyticum]|uniref:Small CPxCG-related zinc finger protein n=1 Tax=Halogranum amylolyticum TaxID=660520 RepID=A0A1H8UET2_9EURY|nr:hypothetical protein [Halogranum amylolyticum]SEP01138.1 hypothetical protein SAMN04487948_110121 [Halogranum amylolyticum]